MLSDAVRILLVNQHVDRKIDIGGADARGVECKAADLQRKTPAVSIFQRAIEYRLAIWRRPDDLVRRLRSDLDPIAFRVNEVKKVLTILFERATHQCIEVEFETAFDQCRLILS